MAAPRFQFLILACTRETACPFLLSPEVKKCFIFFYFFNFIYFFHFIFQTKRDLKYPQRQLIFMQKRQQRDETDRTEEELPGGLLCPADSLFFCFLFFFLHTFLFFYFLAGNGNDT